MYHFESKNKTTRKLERVLTAAIEEEEEDNNTDAV